ncbi:hypothetical protein A3B02_01020 [Candidatus Roizmanbacteria bacterium RIFCSPLOWO2_01_FULL_42_14]|uniref:Uncharacterized protein n=4 Tax=Candidatus Roizmaniibacteriota TaxID=1752723 RepID=A0A1F7JXA0_9BACT|nr:MAG: hypothetical protein A3D08_02780 [Candidatus Roizmanbacteria bacterium RIFCSPHIGHO2_02_FULL_43_11]OGK38117.1 MAG: hypothetical protein A3F32_00080 [Candidatus Roizmanbacteria bacterium RIFCSPHIGHO2_12_FULL_42_10]OGK52571.1 MAG: hypothetical protein A3B02_01020 [Candidatus Roizmanbacteria bacterium RIFCSPLOWO2_01_FULL_42_14]OGK60240.1 MAG: hypothetical protein A3I56_01585 [Candidatus Roizmanbacteria bacterium RIFCSPLOWO2_02_FULL_43_10]
MEGDNVYIPAFYSLEDQDTDVSVDGCLGRISQRVKEIVGAEWSDELELKLRIVITRYFEGVKYASQDLQLANIGKKIKTVFFSGTLLDPSGQTIFEAPMYCCEHSGAFQGMILIPLSYIIKLITDKNVYLSSHNLKTTEGHQLYVHKVQDEPFLAALEEVYHWYEDHLGIDMGNGKILTDDEYEIDPNEVAAGEFVRGSLAKDFPNMTLLKPDGTSYLASQLTL